MKNNTTHEILIKNLYNECTNAEKGEIKLQLLLNSELYNENIEFKMVKKGLNTLRMQPSVRIQKNILAYACLF